MKKRTLFASGALISFSIVGVPQISMAKTPAAVSSAESQASGEIVVTARRRDEALSSVPVAVSAFSAAELQRANPTDISKIANIVPNVIISNFRANGGGSISIRGISSPATSLGFEQAVSVSIDGVQTSSGFLAQVGFFDVEQLEVLKGPQALMFGKNSPAGVISLRTAQPTEEFEASIRASYEFEADEAVVDGIISGPLSDTLTARLAVRGRNMEGWLHNDAKAVADNPFIAGPDQGLRGASDSRVGDEEAIVRLTLAYAPTDALDLNLKMTYDRGRNGGAGVASQNIGPCPSGQPRVYGITDPYGECKPDNHLTNGDTFPGAANPGGPADGRSKGELDALSVVLNGSYDLGSLSLVSTTGYTDLGTYNFGNYDQTTFSQVNVLEDNGFKAFSEELRLNSEFSGPLNFMTGVYYQSQETTTNFRVKLRDSNFNPVANSYYSFVQAGSVDGDTLSLFGQLRFDVTHDLELAGGLRWSREEKSLDNTLLYGFPAVAFPSGKNFKTKFSDENVSPEVTLSWHPVARSTIYAAYRTGYKSGGYNLTSPIQASTTIGDIDFGPEKAEGFEVGAKGYFFDGRLFLDANAYAFTFSDLQVNAYDPARVAYTVSNAGKVEQKGIEFQGTLQATDSLKFRGAISYNQNRFKDFAGQCYAYSYAAGDVTSPPPPNCSFIPGTRTLQQDFEGRAPARAPDWAGNIGVVYTRQLASAFDLEVYGDAAYSSGYYAAETAAPSTYQDSYWRLNAGVSIAQTTGGWSLALSGQNLTNEHYLLFASDRTGGIAAPLTIGEQRGVVARGRQIMLEARYKF